MIGIAKREEELFFPNQSKPLILDKRSDALKTLQHMRNEAHRFGISHHRNKRSKLSNTSILDDIPGIGDKLKERLFLKFKTIENIKNAELVELISIVGEKRAALIRDLLH